MERYDSNNLKDTENAYSGISYDTHVCFRATENFKEELEDVADNYNTEVSDILREAVIRLLKQEAKAQYGGGSNDE